RGAAVPRGQLRCAHVHLSAALRGRSRRHNAGARARAAPGRAHRLARVRHPAALARAPGLARLHRPGAARAGAGDIARVGRGRSLPGPQHQGLLRAPSTRAHRRALAPRGARRGARAAHEPGRRSPHVGAARARGGACALRGRPMSGMRATHERPAFYALGRGRVGDLVTLLHPPYTAWHLSYFALGAAAAPHLHVDRLLWGLAAFALAVGVAAHALDELHGHPLGTAISDRTLAVMAATTLLGAVVIGIAGVVTVSVALVPLVLAGALFLPAYNLELAGGRFHSDLWF